MGCQSLRSGLTSAGRARSSTERLQSPKTGERAGSRPQAAEGGGASAPALRPADHRVYFSTVAPEEAGRAGDKHVMLKNVRHILFAKAEIPRDTSGKSTSVHEGLDGSPRRRGHARGHSSSPAVADQVIEQVEHLWCNRNEVRPATQFAPVGAECALLEEIAQACESPWE